MSAEKRYWIAFNATRGIGPVRFARLLDHFGSMAAAWQASLTDLSAAGLDRRSIESLHSNRSTLDLDALLAHIERLQLTVLTWADDAYPARLRDIPQSPPVLYLRGALAASDDWAVAVVGTRSPTPYGREVAQHIGDNLVAAGVTVVSGLARGIDGIAHRRALASGGRTLAVLGNGLDRIYPREHKRLANEIVTHGALVSDYAPGTRPESGNFPARNRIIAGLSRATIVVEAGQKSGALITATNATEQGRMVFAVPGSIFSPRSVGANQLLRDGAQPFISVPDLLEALQFGDAAAQQDARQVLATDPAERALLAELAHDPLHVDELQHRTGMPVAQVTGLLALMELKGTVRQVGHMNYVAVREPGAPYAVD